MKLRTCPGRQDTKQPQYESQRRSCKYWFVVPGNTYQEGVRREVNRTTRTHRHTQKRSHCGTERSSHWYWFVNYLMSRMRNGRFISGDRKRAQLSLIHRTHSENLASVNGCVAGVCMCSCHYMWFCVVCVTMFYSWEVRRQTSVAICVCISRYASICFSH